MPPKRKASTALEEQQPTMKRTLRSNKTVTEEVALPVTTRESRRVAGADAESEHTVDDAPVATRSRRTTARPAAVPKPPEPGPKKVRARAKKPTKTNRRGVPALVEEETEETDELLLSPSKKPSVRSATPPRLVTPTTSTSRVFLECVEILTPSRRLAHGPPSARSSRRSIARAASPSPNKRSVRPGPHSKLQPAQDTHGSPGVRGALPIAGPSSEPISPPASPSRLIREAPTPTVSPSRRKGASNIQAPPTRWFRTLPPHLHPSLYAQQRAILRSLRHVPDIDEDCGDRDEDDEPATNAIALEELSNLLRGTVIRGEGNSCLLIGPRGSGKTRIVQQALAALPERPITVYLSGHAQQNDRLAIREIARQLTQQTGQSFLPSEDEKLAEEGLSDPENPFLDKVEVKDFPSSIALPAPAHLLALISMIPTLPRATVIVLDGFDQFASHARQSLLYCLLDTAQSCRVGKDNKGLAVIGVTTRVDTINLLEKRVKSRFSGRMLRTACPRRLQDWISLIRAALNAPTEDEDNEWDAMWPTSVENFLNDPEVKECLKDTFGLTRDVHTLRRMLTSVVLDLSPASPFLSPAIFTASAGTQRCPPRFPFLSALPYPSICLLIAAMHARTSGHESFTFEMLHEAFRGQVRTSQSAPVQVDGGSIGMVRCSREVLLGAFERLVAQRVFLATVAPSSSLASEFVPHRCAIDRVHVKKAVEAMGQTNLKKWLNKAQ